MTLTHTTPSPSTTAPSRFPEWFLTAIDLTIQTLNDGEEYDLEWPPCLRAEADDLLKTLHDPEFGGVLCYPTPAGTEDQIAEVIRTIDPRLLPGGATDDLYHAYEWTFDRLSTEIRSFAQKVRDQKQIDAIDWTHEGIDARYIAERAACSGDGYTSNAMWSPLIHITTTARGITLHAVRGNLDYVVVSAITNGQRWAFDVDPDQVNTSA